MFFFGCTELGYLKTFSFVKSLLLDLFQFFSKNRSSRAESWVMLWSKQGPKSTDQHTALQQKKMFQQHSLEKMLTLQLPWAAKLSGLLLYVPSSKTVIILAHSVTPCKSCRVTPLSARSYFALTNHGFSCSLSKGTLFWNKWEAISLFINDLRMPPMINISQENFVGRCFFHLKPCHKKHGWLTVL